MRCAPGPTSSAAETSTIPPPAAAPRGATAGPATTTTRRSCASQGALLTRGERFGELAGEIALLDVHLIARTVHKADPAIAYVQLDWSDQDSGNLTVTGTYLLGDRSPHPDQDLADRLDEPVWDCACSITRATQRVWQMYMVPGSEPPLLDVAEALTITPPGAGASGEDEFTFRGAQIGWYPADPEPESAGGLVSDMYTLDAFGVSLLLRRRSASTYLHLDTDLSLTGPLLGPLEVEVNNGGEVAYDCGQPSG